MSRAKAVDLFCGAGGASLGLIKAGYEVVGAVDADETALQTYEDNLCADDGVVDDYPGEIRFDEPLQADLSRGYEADGVDGLESIIFKDIREYFDLDPGEVDVICGCPPCQNFSSLRDTEPWPEDKPKDNLLRAFVEFIEEEIPRVVLFENVRNIMNAGEDVPSTYVDWLIRSMSEITCEGDTEDEGGYGCDLDVLNAADYGIPQRRKRTIGLFIYGEDSEDVDLPEKTHTDGPEGDQYAEWVSVDETFELYDDLKLDLESGEKQVDVAGFPDDPEHRARQHHKRTIEKMEAIRRHGWGWRDLIGTDDDEYIVDAHKGLDRGANSAYGIMDGGSPAPTLTTRCTTPSCGRFTHPQMNRGITFREAALLMTFPRWFTLPEKNDAAERVVGNAVPPDFIECIMESVREEEAGSILAG